MTGQPPSPHPDPDPAPEPGSGVVAARAGGTGARRSRLTRALGVLGGAMGVCLTAASIGWFAVLPSYRPELGPDERYGIDVSNHQNAVDWAEVADDGIDYAYMKATEGRTWVDKRFAENWRASAAAGVTRGAYHFFSLCSSGAAQAANFLRTVPADPSALPPVVDLEHSPTTCPDRMDAGDLQRELTDFVAAVEAREGKRVVIYTLPRFVRDYPLPEHLTDRERWVRSLFRRPSTADWRIWQVSAMARVDGIDEPVDLDVWRVDPTAV